MAMYILHLLSLVSVAAATFSLSSTIGSSMVLQRDSPSSTLWGTATPGSVITTTFISSGTSYNATADSYGVWRVGLPSLPATANAQNITFSSAGQTSVTISDILIGDVLLCR